ncbi:MAG TPA: branched-chain amino acid ABC transporter substrate-binding protein [Candidatus Limnocylindrales bacterium]|nr:branched-chain amino acid ABC transporter substrate-binding protein [Candidatus Limnocylindrales bacterium]
MFKQKSILFLMFAVVLMMFSVFGCAPQAAPPAEEPEQVLIGIMLPTTGAVAENGIDMENAIKLAVSEINAAGGVLGREIITTTADDGCDPAMATAAASKLIAEEVVAVVGGFCSGATLPTLTIYGDAGIPLVIAAANATTLIAENPGWAFMINSTGDMQAEKAIGWFQERGVETIGLIGDGSAFSADLVAITREQWEAAGKQVVTDDTVSPGEMDFSALVTTIMAANPGGIYWTGYHAEGALITMQLREAGYEGVIIVSDGSSAPAFIELAGPHAEGVYCTAPPFADFLPAAQSFIADYQAMFDRAPGAYAGLSYDAMHLLADAITRAGSFDGAAIRDALAATDGFEGISGEVMFTEENTLGRSNFVLLVAQGGSWVLAQ